MNDARALAAMLRAARTQADFPQRLASLVVANDVDPDMLHRLGGYLVETARGRKQALASAAKAERRCSFCFKPQGQVLLVAGSHANICEECVARCVDALKPSSAGP